MRLIKKGEFNIMKKIDSLRKIAEAFISKQVMTPEHSKLILKAQASLKEHVLNGDCTYCGKKVDRELLKMSLKSTIIFLMACANLAALRCKKNRIKI